MSILIKGMNLPKEGYRQVFITAEGEVIYIPSTPVNGEKQYKVVELPPQEKYEGLKRKYVVLKAEDGEEVNNCFVLRPNKDKAAIAALLAYADATENQVLAADIRKWISSIIPADEVTPTVIEAEGE